MTQEQKIIRAKLGLLELAKQLGNVSQACKMMGYSRQVPPPLHPAVDPIWRSPRPRRSRLPAALKSP
jgi:hypothetical protein